MEKIIKDNMTEILVVGYLILWAIGMIGAWMDIFRAMRRSKLSWATCVSERHDLKKRLSIILRKGADTMKQYINIDRIPKKVQWRQREKAKKQRVELSKAEKVGRIERLARKMGIKIGG